MADVFRNFTGAVTTANTTIFTVPQANVAATPPVPATTFVAKTLYAVHDLITHAKTLVTIFHVDVSESNTISFQAEVTAGVALNLLQNGIYVFESGDQLLIKANNNGQVNFSCSLLEIKAQQ